MSKYAAQAARWRHGHEKAEYLRTAMRRIHRREVKQAMRWHAQHTDLIAAVARTSRLLSYTSYASPAHRWLTTRLTTVRERCSAQDVLQRVIEFYTLVDREPHHFPNADSEHLGLAKAVLPMARRKHQDYQSRLYRKGWYVAAGRYIAKELAGPAITFVRANLAPLVEAENNTNEESYGR